MKTNKIGERIELLINHTGSNINSFAKELGYKSSEKLRRVVKEDNAYPSYTIIYDIAKMFANLNMKWLITGEGSMFYDQVLSNQVNEPFTSYADINVKEVNEIIVDQAREIYELRKEITRLRTELNKLR